jgi:medium-chain acyl-[acyl-carrier-protein] hydrolase
MRRADKLLVPVNRQLESDRGVVFVPHAAAGAATFAPFGQTLEVAAWAARFPGRESRIRETALTTIEAMADALAASVCDLDTGELVLFGHCSGALVVYEAALRLRERTAADKRLTLVVSSCAAPVWRARPRRNVARMSDEDLVALMTADGGTSRALVCRHDFLELILPVYRADLLAMEQYDRDRPPRRVDIPVLALAGEDDEDLPEAAFTAWAQVTDGPFSARRLVGDHFYLTGQEQRIAEILLGLFEVRAER